MDIAPVQLTSGSTYIIAAFMPAPVIDYTVVWQRVALTNGIVSFDPRIEFVAYRAGASPGGISFPESRFTDIAGAFGPNFIIAVPEPSPIALFLAAAGMLILRVSQTQKVLSTRSLQ